MERGAQANGIRAVLLDVDGTLVDSNRQHARAWSDALREHGHAVSPEEALRLIGMGGDKVLPELSGLSPDSRRGAGIDARRRTLFRDRYLPRVRALPGAADLVAELRRRGLRLVVASSAEPDILAELLRIAGLPDLAADAASNDGDSRSKPDPDLIVRAVERAAVPPRAALMLGDTPYDVAAARRAGVRVVGLRSGGWEDAALVGSLAIFDDPADVLAHLGKPPLAGLLARREGPGSLRAESTGP
jgi:HAD superfamily hydrolase (TIGR01509 family)